MDPLVISLAAAVLAAIVVGVLRSRGMNEQLSRLRAELEAARHRLDTADLSASEQTRHAFLTAQQ